MSSTPLKQHLQGKVVVVTGGGAGLGQAYAEHAARSGATVVINDVDADRAEAATQALTDNGLDATAVAADISDWHSAGELIDGVVAKFGRLDGLVNNAGIFYRILPWQDDGERAARLVAVNLLGVLFCGFHAMRVMVGQGHGSLVNITSGAHLGMPEMGTYGASKGGVASATYSWAADLAGTGVRANAVSPIAATAMARVSRNAGPDEKLPLPAAANVAPLVTYLLSDLSASVNGQVFRLIGSTLSTIRRPEVGAHSASDPDWSVGAIADAVRGPLAADIRPVEGPAH